MSIHSEFPFSRKKIIYADSNHHFTLLEKSNVPTLIFFKGALHNQKELSTIFGINETLSEYNFLLQCYLKYNLSFISKLRGRFAFVINDPQKNQVICVRDQFGLQPFYYYYKNDADFIFATRLCHLLPYISTLTDDKTYLKEMFSLSLLGEHHYLENTRYQQIKKLMPSYITVLNEKGILKNRYWQPEKLPTIKLKNTKAYVEKFKFLFEQAVTRCTQNHHKIALEVSGGIDSSCIAAVAVKKEKDKCFALTNTLPDSLPKTYSTLFSEFDFSKATCNALGIKQYTQFDDFDIYQALDAYGCQFPGFIENTYGFINLPLYQKAHNLGASVLLSGFGGDQLVSQQGHLLLSELKQDKKYLSFALNYYLQNGINDILLKLINRCTPKYFKGLKSPTIHFRKALRQLLSNDMQDYFDKKLAAREKYTRDKIYSTIFFPSIGLLSGFITSRVESSALLADTLNLEMAYPMLDVDLVEFCHQCPTTVKSFYGKNRYLIKAALKNDLPDYVIKRTDKKGSMNAATHIKLLDTFINDFKHVDNNSSFYQFFSNYFNINEIKKRLTPSIQNLTINEIFIKAIVMQHMTNLKREKKDDLLV